MSYARSAVTRMTLDMGRPDLQRSETVTQGDTNRRWEVTLINGGAPFRLPPNWTAALTGIKPDGNGLQNGCSVVDGKIIYDFAAGKEIATCVGSYPVQFDVWDEVGELVASPKVYVNVLADVRPHAELESNGQYTQISDAITKINNMETDVDILADTVLAQGDDIAALKEKITTAGSVTIPASEWDALMPTKAYVTIQGGEALTRGGLLLVMPGDTATKDECERARVRIDIDLITDQQPPSVDQIVFVRAEERPAIPLNFKYYVLKTESQQGAVVALIGVDAYGEGGGAASGVDEEAVKALIDKEVPEWARSKTKPTYTPEEVKARPDTWMPTASDVKADPEGTAEGMTTALRGEVNNALDACLKSADLPAKLDEYRAAKGLIDNTVSNLVNYYTKSQTLNKDEINALVSAIPKFDIEVVASLPIYNISETTVYLVKSGADSSNLYIEYIHVKGAWERLGTQTVDLTGYATEAWVNTLLAAYVKTADMEAYVTGLLKAYITKDVADETYQPAGDYLARNELNAAINTALAEAKESGEFDGTSVTVSKVNESDESGGENVVEFSNGKKLTVLNGWDGRDGNPGKDGKTPVNGVDYFTPAEISNIKSEIGAELSQIPTPAIVSSVNEMTDTAKHYVLQSSGHIYASRTIQTGGDVIRTPNFTNLFDKSAVTLNAYIGGSDDAAEDGSFVTSLMPFDIKTLAVPQTIRIANWYGDIGYHKRNKIAWYPSGAFNINCVDQLNNPAYVLVDSSDLDLQTITCQTGKIPNTNTATTSKITGFKLSFRAGASAITLNDIPDDMIITVNEEITYTETTTPIETTTEWYDTGISYSPTFKTDLIGVMGENKVIYLSDNLPSGTYTLVDPGNNYATVGIITR